MANVYQDPKEQAIYEAGKKQGADDFFQLLLVNVYARKVQDFHNYNTMARKGGIVFLGDSITDNYDVYEYYHGYDVYNRGIGGDTSEGVLQRLKESVYELEPGVVVLLIGTNDFQLCENHKPEDILARIKTICETIHAHLPKTQIILESIYPVYNGINPKVDSLSVGSKTNAAIDQTNVLLQAYHQPYVHYLDVNSALKGPDGNVQLDYTMEGLHTSTTGYFVVTRLVKEALKELGVVPHER